MPREMGSADELCRLLRSRRSVEWLQLDRVVQCRCWIWQRMEGSGGDPCSAALPWRLSSFALARIWQRHWARTGHSVAMVCAHPAGSARHDRDPGGVIERGGARWGPMGPDRIITAGTCQLFRLHLSRYRHAVSPALASGSKNHSQELPPHSRHFLHPRVAADLNSPAATHEGTRLSQRL